MKLIKMKSSDQVYQFRFIISSGSYQVDKSFSFWSPIYGLIRLIESVKTQLDTIKFAQSRSLDRIDQFMNSITHL